MGKDPNKERKTPVMKPVGLDASYVAPKLAEPKAVSQPSTTIRASVLSPTLYVVPAAPAEEPEKRNWAEGVEKKPDIATHAEAIKPTAAMKFVRNMVWAARDKNPGNFTGQERGKFLRIFEQAANSQPVRIALETSPVNDNRFSKALWKSFKQLAQESSERQLAQNPDESYPHGVYDFLFDMKDGKATLKEEIALAIAGFSRRYLNSHRHELNRPSLGMAAE